MTGPIEHPDVEALSAYVDGEAPEWAAHVAGCAACRASVDELRAVAGAVGAPVAPAPDQVREAALAAALAAAAGPAPAVEEPPPAGSVASLPLGRPRSGRTRRTPTWWMLPGAAAAVVVLLVGVTVLFSARNRSTSTGRTALPALEADPTAGAANNSQVAAPAVPDLGDIPDATSLAARARPSLGAKSSPNSGATSDAASPLGAPAPAAVPGAGGGASSLSGGPTPTAAVAGTRPCEEQARARQPSLGPVVYFATATRNGAPAVVIGFASGPSASGPVTLLLLAQNGCGELLRSVAP